MPAFIDRPPISICRQAVSWAPAAPADRWASSVRLRFTLEGGAHLYSFWTSDDARCGWPFPADLLRASFSLAMCLIRRFDRDASRSLASWPRRCRCLVLPLPSWAKTLPLTAFSLPLGALTGAARAAGRRLLVACHFPLDMIPTARVRESFFLGRVTATPAVLELRGARLCVRSDVGGSCSWLHTESGERRRCNKLLVVRIHLQSFK